jgi:hypothetical protein
MKVYPQEMYGDPSKHVKFESETCKGCMFEVRNHFGKRCRLKKKHGKRCSEYRSLG